VPEGDAGVGCNVFESPMSSDERGERPNETATKKSPAKRSAIQWSFYIISCVDYNRKAVVPRSLAAFILLPLACAQTALQEGQRAFEAGNYAEAARLFGAAHKQSPRCDVLFFLGMSQYRLKQVDSALISFQSAVQCDPKLTFAYLGLGEAYAERGNDQEALANYASALKLEPNNQDALRGSADLYLRGKLFEKAVETLEVLVKLDSASPQVHALLGSAYYGAGNQDRAEAQFDAALRLKPNFPSAMLGLANIYLRKGLQDKAVTILQKLVKLAPNSYEPHYMLGTAYNRQNRYQDAVAELHTALQLGGNEPEIYYHLARAYGGLGLADDRTAALAKFGEVTKKSKADAAAQRQADQLVEQAKRLVDSGDLNTAALRLESARELRPSDATILFRLGSLYYDLQRYELARDYAQEAASLAPSEWLYHYLLGLIEKSLKDWKEAQGSLDTALELKPSAAEVLNAMGLVALAQGDSKRAVNCFQRAVELDPNQQAYRENLNDARAAAAKHDL
jgi:tetratricopeptide (TPR) repeat protein